jgi:hypothetical protein
MGTPLTPHWTNPSSGLPLPGISAPALPVTEPSTSILGAVAAL